MADKSEEFQSLLLKLEFFFFFFFNQFILFWLKTVLNIYIKNQKQLNFLGNNSALSQKLALALSLNLHCHRTNDLLLHVKGRQQQSGEITNLQGIEKVIPEKNKME